MRRILRASPEAFGPTADFSDGSEFSICDVTVQTFPCARRCRSAGCLSRRTSGLGFITDLGYATKMVVERLREVHTLVIERS